MSARPVTAIGSSVGGEETELAGVTSAFRLADGRVVLANGSPLEVRVYSAGGVLVSRLGRKGQGPGEYRGRITVYPGGGDSVRVFDEAMERWTVYTATGKLGRTWLAAPEEQRSLVPIAVRRTLVHPIPEGINACLRSIIATVPTPRDSAYLEVMADGTDRFWLRSEGAVVWRVVGLDGGVRGSVLLPKGLELFQVSSGFVTGKLRVADDVEQVVVFAVSMPAHTSRRPACAARVDSIPRDTVRVRRNLQIDLRNLESASEAYRKARGHFASLDSIRASTGYSTSPGSNLAAHTRNGTGLDVTARKEGTAGYCRLLIGDIAPAWLYRFAWCDWGEKR